VLRFLDAKRKAPVKSDKKLLDNLAGMNLLQLSEMLSSDFREQRSTFDF
jgi:hypothetical protein